MHTSYPSRRQHAAPIARPLRAAKAAAAAHKAARSGRLHITDE